jgi:hypothetical protein
VVHKLKENDKRVIGCGVKSSTSNLLIASCDEFIYYDDLVRAAERVKPEVRRKGKPSDKKDKKQEGLERLVEIVNSLETEYDPLWGSLVKQTIRRVYPGFSEQYYGFQTFSDLLEEAEDEGLIVLDYDDSRGNYKVRTKKPA